jgi:hypothetical protein
MRPLTRLEACSDSPQCRWWTDEGGAVPLTFVSSKQLQVRAWPTVAACGPAPLVRLRRHSWTPPPVALAAVVSALPTVGPTAVFVTHGAVGAVAAIGFAGWRVPPESRSGMPDGPAAACSPILTCTRAWQCRSSGAPGSRSHGDLHDDLVQEDARRAQATGGRPRTRGRCCTKQLHAALATCSRPRFPRSAWAGRCTIRTTAWSCPGDPFLGTVVGARSGPGRP